jgi:predicted nucleic-acid-binding protein
MVRAGAEMIGIDTNILLRLLVRDDEDQVRIVEQFMASHCSTQQPGYVSQLVIAELAWVLKDVYGYHRPQIASAINGLLKVASLEVESDDDIKDTVSDFVSTSAGFTDCLLARTNVTAGCDYTVTFDRKAARLTGFRLLQAR